MPLVLTKKESNQKQEAGVLVKEHIENAKEDLERERKELRNQVFEDGWTYSNFDNIDRVEYIFCFLFKVVVEEFHFFVWKRL